MNYLKSATQVLSFISILLLFACNNLSSDKQGVNQIDEEDWRSSELLINSEYFNLFTDSLKRIRNASDFLEADSLLRNSILEHENEISSEKFVKILRIYQNDFNSSPKSKAFSNEEIAVSFLRLSKLDSVLICAKAANEEYIESDDEDGIARTELITAAALSFKGDYASAMSHQLVALGIYTEQKDSAGIYSVLAELSMNNFNDKRYSTAALLSERVLQYAESQKDTFLAADMLNTLGAIYHQLKRDDKAKASILKSIELRQKLNDDFGLAQAYGGMSMIKMSEAKWQEAKEWCEKSISISKEIEDYRNLNTIYYNLGTCLFEMEDYDQAEAIFEKVINLSDSNGIKDIALIQSLERISGIMKAQNRIEEQNEYLSKLLNIKEELFSEDKLRIAEELSAKFKISEKQQKLDLIALEKSQLEEKKFIMAIALILVIFLSTTVMYFMFQRNQNRKRLFETEQSLKQELVNKIQRELQFNKEQLNDFTHHLVEKNKIIFALENKLISKVKAEEQQQRLKNFENDEEEEVSSLLQLRILTEDDWSKFKIYFDKVFPGLILSLRQTHPTITGSEERLFLLMKLKSDSREMSEILGISMESVRKNKYRLKKKLNLNENMALEEYIHAF
jgi:tetratricopeptide (TPR) repeat protein/DNA-binding CsgD family transcriptional regulator